MLHASTHPLLWRLALASMIVAALAGGTSVLARQGDPPATDDRPEFRSIAELELALDDDSLAWQATELPAFLVDDRPIPFYDGFLYAHDTPLLIYRDGGGRYTRLGADKAMPVEGGDMLAPVSLHDDATFLALELVAEDDALEPVGDPFLPEADDYVLELLRAESEGAEDEEAQGAQETEDEPVRLEAAELPVLLVVVAGEVELRVEDEDPEELKAGDVLTVDEEFDLRWLGEEPSVVLAARLRLPKIGDDAEGDEEEGQEEDAGGSLPVRTPASGPRAGGGADSGSGGGSGGGAGESDPTPTPKPTEEPGNDPGGELPPGMPPPPDDPPGGGSGGGSGGSGSGGVGVEQGPGDGECIFCAPSDGGDDLVVGGPSGDPCLLANGGGDPDFDELNNCGEAAAGTYPTVQDTDNDGSWDGFEVRTGTNPLVKDTDRDGIGDWDEFTYSTNPLTPDTDSDGVTDSQELFTYGTRPKEVDSDWDCLWDGDEIFVYGTNPNREDSDGDLFYDLVEINQGYNPLDSGSHPDEEAVAGLGCNVSLPT